MEEFKPDLAIGTTPVVQKAKELTIPALYFTNLISARPLMGPAGAGSLAQVVNAAIANKARFDTMKEFFAGVGEGHAAGVWADVGVARSRHRQHRHDVESDASNWYSASLFQLRRIVLAGELAGGGGPPSDLVRGAWAAGRHWPLIRPRIPPGPRWPVSIGSSVWRPTACARPSLPRHKFRSFPVYGMVPKG